MTMMKSLAAAAAIVVLGTASAFAQAAPTPPSPPSPPAPYGTPINFEKAKKALAAAEEEAVKNKWNVVITIVDSTGHLVALSRFDNVQYASLRIAEGKARTALDFRRPTKALEDAVSGGGAGLRFLAIEGLTPLEGGIPIVVDGKIIGAIGVSGVTSAQDAQIARAGAEAAK
jgi:glc operon protein GlcG